MAFRVKPGIVVCWESRTRVGVFETLISVNGVDRSDQVSVLARLLMVSPAPSSKSNEPAIVV